MHICRKFLAAPAVGVAAMLLTGAPATASTPESGSAMADLQLVFVNDASGSGPATLEVEGTMLRFSLAFQGPIADAPHIHFRPDVRYARYALTGVVDVVPYPRVV